MPVNVQGEDLDQEQQEDSFYEFLQGEEAPKAKRGRPKKRDVPPADHTPVEESPAKTQRVSKREAGLRDAYFTIGVMVFQVNETDGQIIISGAEGRAHEVAMLAKKYPEFGKWVDRTLAGNVWVAFAIGHGTMLYAIAANHNAIPAGGLVSLFRRRKPVSSEPAV